MNDLISIIVPVYNVEQYLNRCMETLLSQTYQNMEILLIDDGSEDGSLELCKQYAKKDKRVRVIHKENEGLGITRNCGLNNATGKFIMFVDSDDFLEFHTIELLYKDIVEQDADMVLANHYYKDIPRGLPIEAGLYCGQDITDIIYLHMLGRHGKAEDDLCVSVWTNLYKKEIIEQYGLCFPSERKLIWEDLAFNTEYLRYCNRVFVEEIPLYHYCYNGESLTHCYASDRLQRILDMYQYMQEQILKYNFTDIDMAKKRLQNRFIGNIRTCLKLEVFYGNKNGRRLALERVKNICKNTEVRVLLKEYPVNYYTWIQRIYHFAIIHRLYSLVYVLTWLQNKKKRIE